MRVVFGRVNSKVGFGTSLSVAHLVLLSPSTALSAVKLVPASWLFAEAVAPSRWFTSSLSSIVFSAGFTAGVVVSAGCLSAFGVSTGFGVSAGLGLAGLVSGFASSLAAGLVPSSVAGVSS